MDIFKLGDKILDLLNAIFAFWNNQISLVFELLGQSPTAFKGGGPWDVIAGNACCADRREQSNNFNGTGKCTDWSRHKGRQNGGCYEI